MKLQHAHERTRTRISRDKCYKVKKEKKQNGFSANSINNIWSHMHGRFIFSLMSLILRVFRLKKMEFPVNIKSEIVKI